MASASSVEKRSYWIVVANESQAIFYERPGPKESLVELTSLKNEQARMKSGDLQSDREGRSFDSHGQGRHSMTREKSNAKTNAAIAFAKEIVNRISRAHHDQSMSRFALIAAPRFLGLLRDALRTAGNLEPEITIDKDVIGRDAADIKSLLEKH